ALEAMPVYAGDQVQAPDGSGYDSVNDALGGAGGTYAPIASPTFTGTVTAPNLTATTGVTTVALTATGNASLGDAGADVTLVWGHLKHKSAAPTIAPGVALGTGGAVGATIAGTDQEGTLTVTAGTTSLTTGRMATVTFNA